jgi:hypothetical protein
MNPRQSFKVAIAGIALLLTACAPVAMASTPPAAPTATDAEVAIVDATGTTVPTAPTALPATQAPTAIPLAATSNTMQSNATASTDAAVALAQPQGPAYENLNSPVDLLASYYDAINRKQYQRAYGYWQSPPMAYQQFANGFSDTTSVQLIVQPPTRGEGAAGSTYVQIATVLIAQHTDGSTHTYGGCFVTRKSNLQPPDIPKADVWHIYSAQLEEIPNNIYIPNQLAQSCQS